MLRAIAVAGVVLAHVWPERLPGGFVGVDVFFVVSGYLISAHLLTELRREGRIGVLRFWGRRIRRLLPAAFLVLFVSLALTMTVVPAPSREDSLTQIIASAFYVQNWVLAFTSVDYFSLEQAPTLVQHFWSLSVEEQFYIFWPLVLVTMWVLARRSTRSLTAAVALIGVASCALAVAQSASPGHAAAYFSTLTRVWEFCAGALIALASALPAGQLPERFVEWRRWSGVVGVAAIVASFFTIGPETPYPGVATLLPVIGTILVMIGGTPGQRLSIGALAGSRPAGVVGDLSYSIYLWHWPLIVIAPALLLPLGGLNTFTRVAVIGVSVAMAFVTKRFVEDRFRYPSQGGRSWRTFAIPVTGCAALVALVVGAQTLVIAPQQSAAAARMASLEAGPCFGAQAVINGCADPFGPADTIDPSSAANDRAPECARGRSTEPPTRSLASCEYPAEIADAPVLALVGDSHAGAIASTVAWWARSRGMTLRLYSLSACPNFGANPGLTFPNDIEATSADSVESWQTCVGHGAEVLDEIVADSRVSSVIVTNSTLSYTDPDDPGEGAITASTVEDSLEVLLAAGKQVAVLVDVPGLEFGNNAPMCLAQHETDPARCAAPIDDVAGYDAMLQAADATHIPTVSLRDLFCDEDSCYAAVGGVVAYWDRAHLTETMLDSLAPVLRTRLDDAFNVTNK